MHPNIPIEENWNRELDAVRDTHISNDRAWSCDRQCRLYRLVRPDAFQCRIDPDSVCQRKDRLVCLFTTLSQDIRRTDCARKLLANRVAAQGNDALCPEAFRRNDGTQIFFFKQKTAYEIPLLHLCTD